MAETIDVVEAVRRDDIVIAFMGPTGSGKSYFIDLLTNQLGQPAQRSNDTLKHATNQVQATRVHHHKQYGDRIVLIDTPGFDYAARSDMEILSMISDWLQQAYEKEVRLSGLVYLHRITDNRMAGTSLKYLRMFGELCGDAAMDRIMLVSSMWQKVKPEVGAAREEELRSKFWKPLIDKGSRVDRLRDAQGPEAWRIIEQLIERSEEREVLLQEELIGQQKNVIETQAGKALYTTLQKSLDTQKGYLKLLFDHPTLKRKVKKEYEETERESRGTFGVSTKIDPLLEALSHVLKDPQKRSALQGLKGDDAQLVIDYIYSLLQRPEFTTTRLRKHSIIALYRLCSTAKLHPQSYVLKNITRSDTCRGGGGFADIYKGHYGGQDLCMKVIRPHKDVAMNICAKEAILWGQLHHINIVPFYGLYHLDEKRQQFCLVSPWMNNGNLVDYLEKNASIPRIPFIYDTAAGLEYLHSQNVVHGDMKGLNILVDDLGRARITDFGLSRIRVGDTLPYPGGMTAAIGFSFRWVSPELLEEGSHPTPASDIWAFGCVCYEILVGKVPFHRCKNDSQVIRKLYESVSPIEPVPATDPNQVDEDMWDLMERCCAREPKDRPKCQAILRELELMGVSVKDKNEDHGQVMYEELQFRNKLRRKGDVMIDFRRVEQIFNGIQDEG